MFPDDLKYTREHEWVRVEDSGCTVGITQHAVDQLGDITFIELPEVGLEVATGGAVGAVESVKAASDVYAPVSGEVAEVNDQLEDRPELVNEVPYGDGWFFKLQNIDESGLESLMDAAAYTEYVGELDE